MIKKSMAKKICILLTATLLATLSPFVFATETISPLDEPTPVSINIGANYFQEGEEGDNTYKVIFSSLDTITNYKNFELTIDFAHAVISSFELNPLMQTGGFSTGQSNGNKTFTLTHGSETTLCSGKLTFCTLYVTTDGTELEENITFTLNATNESDEEITFAPTLMVEAGPVVPPLSEKEQEIYDAIVALPEASAVSFFNDGTLKGLNDITDIVKPLKEKYDNSLTETERTNIIANLEYNVQSTTKLAEVASLVSGMETAYNAMMFADIIGEVADENLANYLFMLNVYTDEKENFVTENLTAETTAKDEFDSAISALDADKASADSAFSALSKGNKINCISLQLEELQKYSKSVYYNDFLTDLSEQASALKTAFEDSDDEAKEFYIGKIQDEIDKIELVKKGISSMPTFTVEEITVGSNYSVIIERASDTSIDAIIKLVVYNKDGETKIEEKEYDFDESKTRLSASTLASNAVGYPEDDDVIIEVYYKVLGAEFFLGKKTVYCDYVEPETPSRPVGIPSVNTKPSTNPDTSGGTKYPSGDDKDDKETNIVPPVQESKLFNDIGNYSWASEAIEGLYYAGIINGMEEGVFNPAGSVTREQFCKMVVQLFGVLEYETDTSFGDVDSNAWYAQYINSAIKAGYVQGQSDTYFGIGESIMRQDMATILFRALGSHGRAVELTFTDNSAIAPYAQDAIAELVGLGVFNGYEDGSFKPRGTATRAEAAKVIWEIYKKINK